MDVNIRDRRGEGVAEFLLFAFIAAIAGTIIFGLFPGILLTSFLNYFIALSIGKLWGFSIVLSLAIYILIYYRNKHSSNAFKKYIISAVVAESLIGLSALFFEYNFAVRTVIRMFDSANSILYEYLSSPSEISKEIAGNYVGKSYNRTNDTYIETVLVISEPFDGKINGVIQWTHGDGEISYNRLSGLIDNGSVSMATMPDEKTVISKQILLVI